MQNIRKKDDKVTAGIFLLYFCRTRLNEAYIANVSFAILQSLEGHLPCCPQFYLVALRFSFRKEQFPIFLGQEKISFLLQSMLSGFLTLQS